MQEYVGIVLGNSVYPEVLSVEHDFSFSSSTKELTLTVLIAAPSALPPQKTFRFVKARDEITSTPLTMRDAKERYASVVDQIALRTLHEVFEADRKGWIDTIALSVATEAHSAATGRMVRTTLLAVAGERQSFMSFDLANVLPSATLEHLGAAVSKSPYDLKGIDTATGVRTRR